MLLEQIEERQRQLIAALATKKPSPKILPPARKVASDTRLVAFLRHTHRQLEEKTVMPDPEITKVVAIKAPLSTHQKMEAFLARHKGDEGLPQSKKDLALACVEMFLDELKLS